MAQPQKGRLVKGPYKPIHRDCAMYFSIYVYAFNNGGDRVHHHPNVSKSGICLSDPIPSNPIFDARFDYQMNSSKTSQGCVIHRLKSNPNISCMDFARGPHFSCPLRSEDERCWQVLAEPKRPQVTERLLRLILGVQETELRTFTLDGPKNRSL